MAVRTQRPLNGSSPDRYATVLLVGLVLVAILSGCASSSGTVDQPRVTSRQPAEGVRAFLLNPLEGYDLSVGADDAVRLDRGFDALYNSGDATTALGIANQLLARDGDLAPARVLSSQVAFVAGDYGSVLRQLDAVVEDNESYEPAILLQARSLDLLGREVDAYRAYLSSASPRAARRVDELSESVQTSLSNEIRDALNQDEVDRARDLTETLAEYFPDSIAAWQGRQQVAANAEDGEAELVAWRELVKLRPPTNEELRRLAVLEVDLGDPTQGLETLQRLADADPNNFELKEELDAAKFSWRLNMLPPEVAEVVRSEQVTRAEFASLLYWVVPGVRSGTPGTARIATDVPVEHAFRTEAVRVLNLGMMQFSDEALRRFSPDTPVSLETVLDVLLRVPQRRGVASACAADYARSSQSDGARACAAAKACALIPGDATCEPRASVGGAQAREMVRRTLNLLGGTRP